MVETFRTAAESAGSCVEQCFDILGARSYLQRVAAGGKVVSSLLPDHLRVPLEGVLTGGDPAEATLCVSRAEAGVAATGTLLLDLTPPADRGATALVPIHAVFLDPSRIVGTLADLGALLAPRLSTSPAYLSLTTGPSRTADIERVLTIGVHGAKELHILLMEGA